jgi:hypothetical protein
MFDITKTYRQEVPAMRFIGKKYYDSDRIEGNFGAKWSEWFVNGWFAEIEKAAGGAEALHNLYEDGDAYIGLMRACEGEPFEYWIGMFTPEGTEVPEGFAYVDIGKAALGVCWLYGKEYELYGNEMACSQRLTQENMELISDPINNSKTWWFFERYGCPRFTTPDDKGNVILDICFYVK